MSVLNPLAREISAKIVFYGPGLSGKTTTLQQIHASIKPSFRGELLSLETEGDRTLFFDFLPVHIEKVNGLDLRLQLYTVPGQVFYAATRRLVLEGADGVVFVADSQRAARDRNIESMLDLEENLKQEQRSLGEVPFVIQYNKRDLPDLMSREELRADLNRFGAPEFDTVAAKNEGVLDALRSVMRLVNKRLGAPDSQRRRSETSRRMAFDPAAIGPTSDGDGMASQLSHAIDELDGDLRPPPTPAAPKSEAGPTIPVAERPASQPPARDFRTVQAPAALPLSFGSLWENSRQAVTIEREISTGHYAEAVHRAAAGVSEILDRLLGPHDPEGSGTRAQLLGLDGREYLELRRLASRPAATITQTDALFAYYVLIAARLKQTRMGRF